MTSQFFANIYLNELDYFVKHILRAKYYIRYVDDFVILHRSKGQLGEWKNNIDEFLRTQLKLELHPQKSSVIPLSKGIDFVGFRKFYYFTLVRKRNIRKMQKRVYALRNSEISYWGLMNIYQGWQAYVKWADSFKLRMKILKEICVIKEERLKALKEMRENKSC
ncbi:MAG: RNA-directed DNA polymerase [Nanoarchaeota archaeon]